MSGAAAASSAIPPGPAPSGPRLLAALGPLIIALSAALAYANSFSAPFIYDDIDSIPRNPTIRALWPLSGPLSPPPGSITVSGRPLLNLSFAVNYALGGLDVRGYHAGNLLIHVLAALTLFGFLRHLLRRPPMHEKFGAASTPLALCIALLWTLHPLQTESVTYVVQRAESLAGLFYLLTLYCFMRGLDSAPRLWLTLSVLACLVGVAGKELVATAPLAVLLCDRAFGAGSFREALRARRPYYAGLLLTWIAVIFSVLHSRGRGGSVGYGFGVDAITYMRVQCFAIIQYLKLAVWPSPLVLDYGVVNELPRAVYMPPAAALAAILALGAVAVRRNLPAGFAAAFFFVVLAPTSSFIPVLTEAVAEHRMYLPLAAVLSCVVLALHARLGRRAFAPLLVWSLALGVATHERNKTYASDVSIWEDSALKRPDNLRAQYAAGEARYKAGDYAMALRHYEDALSLAPQNSNVMIGKAACLAVLGHCEAALALAGEAAEIDPASVAAHYQMGQASTCLGNYKEAEQHYRMALTLNPESQDSLFTLAMTLVTLNRPAEACGYFEKLLAINPHYAGAAENLKAARAAAANARKP